jgi:hypothetical protein
MIIAIGKSRISFCTNEVDPSAMSSKWGRVQHHYDIEL